MNPEERNSHRPSGATMNAVYEVLRELTVDQLITAYQRAHEQFQSDSPAFYYFRWQVAVTIERKLDGRW